MKIKFRVNGISLDRRTLEQLRHCDSIEEKRYQWKVSRNPKEQKRNERKGV